MSERRVAALDALRAQIQAAGIVIFKISLDFGDKFSVVCAFFIKPENGRGIAQTRTRNREFYPVLHRRIFYLTHAPDITCLHFVLQQYFAGFIHHFHYTVGSDFKSFVMRAVFFRLLRHQTHVGHAAHGARIKCAIFFAEIDGLLVNASITTIGD